MDTICPFCTEDIAVRTPIGEFYHHLSDGVIACSTEWPRTVATVDYVVYEWKRERRTTSFNSALYAKGVVEIRARNLTRGEVPVHVLKMFKDLCPPEGYIKMIRAYDNGCFHGIVFAVDYQKQIGLLRWLVEPGPFVTYESTHLKYHLFSPFSRENTLELARGTIGSKLTFRGAPLNHQANLLKKIQPAIPPSTIPPDDKIRVWEIYENGAINAFLERNYYQGFIKYRPATTIDVPLCQLSEENLLC